MEFSHQTVLLNETVEGLNPKANGIYVDGTLGGAGHTKLLAEKLKNTGKIFGFDKDPDAILVAKERLSDFLNVQFIQNDFSSMKSSLAVYNIDAIDGIMLDLGVSSHQLDTPERGFSYHYDAPLDMRMSQSGISAADIVNEWTEGEISDILFRFGEEKYARSIAKGIVQKRETDPITTTLQLAEIVSSNVPSKVKREKNPSRKTFQALRIAVNGELDSLQKAIEDGFSILKTKGRMSIITFHSLEDRIVKQAFLSYTKGCTCPPDFPVCVCDNQPKAKLINKKPIIATDEELLNNRRSRSAKLRILEKM